MKKLLFSLLLVAGTAHAEDQVVERAKDLTAAKMKDPESARFLELVHVPPRGTLKSDLVCGKVNAKNSFGGYVGYRRFVSFGDTVLVEGEDPVMDDIVKGAWQKCQSATAATEGK